MSDRKFNLAENILGGGKVHRLGDSGWRLEIPPTKKGQYSLAQLDDYSSIVRRNFPWSAGVCINLNARASSRTIPGTWGFGLWNDPFGLAILKGGGARLPALPNTAWFFFASDANYLSLRDDLPANGQLAATFSSPRNLPPSLLLRMPLFLLVFLQPVARVLRGWLRDQVRQDAVYFDHDPTEWRRYSIEWGYEQVIFKVDGSVILDGAVAPEGPLGLVIWVDNQYASWREDGRLRFGNLASNVPAWIEIADLEVSPA